MLERASVNPLDIESKRQRVGRSDQTPADPDLFGESQPLSGRQHDQPAIDHTPVRHPDTLDRIARFDVGHPCGDRPHIRRQQRPRPIYQHLVRKTVIERSGDPDDVAGSSQRHGFPAIQPQRESIKNTEAPQLVHLRSV